MYSYELNRMAGQLLQLTSGQWAVACHLFSFVAVDGISFDVYDIVSL